MIIIIVLEQAPIYDENLAKIGPASPGEIIMMIIPGKLYYNFLTIFICLITVVIIWLMFRSSGFEKLSYMMIIGGSLGNIFDRIFYSAVPDFIDIHINNFHWFIFNVADIFITIGIIFLISFEIFGKKN
mgnify:CR=1 FL=1